MKARIKKLKLAIILGTRPEVIKLSEIIKKSDNCFETILIHTGQNYDYTLNEIFFENLGIRKPDYFLDVVGDNLGLTMGNVISKSYDILEKLKPNALLVLGDTNSCLSVISAKRLKIPIFHMEAGNRCRDENLPEEVIRRIVDTTSDVNMCYSEIARKNLNDFGCRPEFTFVVGSPMAEILTINMEKIEGSEILSDLKLKPTEFILVSTHREENVDNPAVFAQIVESINALVLQFNKKVLFSCHPRTRKKIIDNNICFEDNVIVSEPFGLIDYCKLQLTAFCVVSDSGTLAEESAFLKFPAISLRTSSERQEAIDKGVFVIGSTNKFSVLQAVDYVTQNKISRKFAEVPDYSNLNVSHVVVNLIQGYTNLVNTMIWRKN